MPIPMALREKDPGMNEKRRAAFSWDFWDPEMLPDVFLPPPMEKDCRERFESIDGRASSAPDTELFMLTGGYFLPFSEAGGCSARLRLFPPNSEPVRPKSLPLISPIVLDRLWPLASPLWGPLVPAPGASLGKPESRANLGGRLMLGRPYSWLWPSDAEAGMP